MHAVRESPPTANEVIADAREAFVRQHLHSVWRYLRAHGANAHEADDLTQEAFVVALRKDVAQSEPAAAAVFLQRTARFLFLRLRRDTPRAEPLADAVDLLWQRDCADGGDELLTALRGCVALLDDKARRAVELSYGLGARDEASRAEVARDLGMTDNGVKTLLQRTRQRLRECVQRKRS